MIQLTDISPQLRESKPCFHDTKTVAPGMSGHPSYDFLQLPTRRPCQWTPVRRSPHSVASYVKLSHIYIYRFICTYIYIYIHIFSSYILYSLGTWHESTNRLESNPFLKSLRHKPFRLEREEREERVAVGVGVGVAKPSNSGTRFCGGGPRTLHAELPEELPEPSGPGLASSLPGLDFDFHKSTTNAGSFPKYCRRVCSRGVKKTFLLSSKSSMPLPRLA